jgi:predicted DNA-binding transcriptional regulator YafY
VTGITVNNESRPEIVQLSVNPVASRYIESQPFHYSQQVIERNEEYVIIQLHILVAEEFIRDILSYGAEIEVLSPESLRKTMIQRVEEMHKMYRK